jgi:4'-phosphopantetheinyl transferase EntD
MAKSSLVDVGPSHELILASLFEPDVAVACLEQREALPSDESELADASPARQREFAAGRQCARRALVTLGLKPVSIERGDAGEPIWPRGVVGSISHADGLCTAVAAHAGRVRGLGVDVEPDRAESVAFAKRICRQSELAAMERMGPSIEALAAVIFSAKEATYKLQFPLTQDLEAWASLEVLLAPGTFSVRFHGAAASLASGRAHGRWRRARGLVWTGVTLLES